MATKCQAPVLSAVEEAARFAEPPALTNAAGLPPSSSRPYGKPPPDRVLSTTVLVPLTDEGFTHASTVTAELGLTVLMLGALTIDELLSETAEPKRPAVDQPALLSVA